MSALLNMTIANLPSLLKGIVESQKLSLRYMRQEMKRGAGRVRKKFIQQELKGPPGIKAGPLAKGRNIWTYVSGNTTKDLGAKIGISRILHVHEAGMIIEPKKAGGLLYLHEKGKSSPIIAAVPKVVIPARLKFRQLVRGEAPAMLEKVAEAGARGIRVAMLNNLKRL